MKLLSKLKSAEFNMVAPQCKRHQTSKHRDTDLGEIYDYFGDIFVSDEIIRSVFPPPLDSNSFMATRSFRLEFRKNSHMEIDSVRSDDGKEWRLTIYLCKSCNTDIFKQTKKNLMDMLEDELKLEMILPTVEELHD